MAGNLPLLVFPKAKNIKPPKGNGFPITQPSFPPHQKQVQRLTSQFTQIRNDFSLYKASMSNVVSGLEPEAVLVIEIAGKIEDFKQAIEAAGLEWLGEWDLDDIEPDEDFYILDKNKKKTARMVPRRLFLSLVNEAALNRLLSLWTTWQSRGTLPIGQTKWRDVFSRIINLRRWGIEETLSETGMLERWEQYLDIIFPEQKVSFQIELFYRKNQDRRRLNERIISSLLKKIGGGLIAPPIDIPEIYFHALKAEVPANQIKKLLEETNSPDKQVDIELFIFAGIMYFRPTGQQLASVESAEGIHGSISKSKCNLPPISAIIDGVPNLKHEALSENLLLDDPDNLQALYQPGERKHGTSIASLVIYGELDQPSSEQLQRKVLLHPIMQPTPDRRSEYVPEDIFIEDKIHIAVRRMIEGINNEPPISPDIKIINFSIGDLSRPFTHTPSPLARLFDWLAWKYRILFCISAGNFVGDIPIDIESFNKLTTEKKQLATLKAIETQLSERRLLSPAESINALTVGALHFDYSGEYEPSGRIDLFPDTIIVSPASRLGHGFRRSIKPDVLFPGGRQLYMSSYHGKLSIPPTQKAPGQKVAWDSSTIGETSRYLYTCGTSNSTALATRGGTLLYEVIQSLKSDYDNQIKEDLISVLIKALLVHGACHDKVSKSSLLKAYKTKSNSRKIKEIISRYIGYGTVDILRVLSCTEQRGTVIGCGEIGEKEIHEYSFPLPPSMANRKDWRRLIVTLAWFSPINTNHRNLREAKLELSPGRTNWSGVPLAVSRQDTDHNQVQRGTVQHEVLEGEEVTKEYHDGENIRLQVLCKADATNSLDEKIPYGIAVTLEVKEGVNIPIYQELKAKIRPRIAPRSN
ncbi:exopolyphosphatase [Hahella sp. KA22]|uniref:S8 family peptidase n=1 Tax=Hahella sp. KA22 TaxID=1628392 RepID=UPI000FDCFE5F|nr:S8 family peptidase [Hahella sp. KA22]AZZ94843.1 exopolyphosphatase [Hahella sp. KA22]QAY58217.1 exopolyphosphatase [Hahella sp. KA22]